MEQNGEGIGSEILTLEEIDKLLELPEELNKVYLDRKKRALIGSLNFMKRKFYEMPIAIGWTTYAKALKDVGAIVAVRYKMPMINTNVFPDDLVSFALEHEAVESALDVSTVDGRNPLVLDRLRRLG